VVLDNHAATAPSLEHLDEMLEKEEGGRRCEWESFAAPLCAPYRQRAAWPSPRRSGLLTDCRRGLGERVGVVI
jgi:hypothetical protein